MNIHFDYRYDESSIRDWRALPVRSRRFPPPPVRQPAVPQHEQKEQQETQEQPAESQAR